MTDADSTVASRARYLACPGTGGFYSPRRGKGRDVSIKEGGSQIEYGDEDHRIHESFEAELARHGATCRMRAFVRWCHGEIGPTNERDT